MKKPRRVSNGSEAARNPGGKRFAGPRLLAIINRSQVKLAYENGCQAELGVYRRFQAKIGNETYKAGCASLSRPTVLVLNLLEEGCEIHAMRDPTRGGIAASLNEIARQSQVAMEIIEARVPVAPAVAAACEALGLDVFQVANEGKMLIIVAPEDAAKALFIIRRSPYGEAARVIGRVLDAPPGRVTVKTVIGTARLLDPPSGDLLPRIC